MNGGSGCYHCKHKAISFTWIFGWKPGESLLSLIINTSGLCSESKFSISSYPMRLPCAVHTKLSIILMTLALIFISFMKTTSCIPFPELDSHTPCKVDFHGVMVMSQY